MLQVNNVGVRLEDEYAHQTLLNMADALVLRLRTLYYHAMQEPLPGIGIRSTVTRIVS